MVLDPSLGPYPGGHTETGEDTHDDQSQRACSAAPHLQWQCSRLGDGTRMRAPLCWLNGAMQNIHHGRTMACLAA